MTMTYGEEEKFLLDKMLSSRHELKLCEHEVRELRVKKCGIEKQLEDIEQAFIDYLLAHGVLETQVDSHSVKLTESFNVDVPDIDVLPEMYIRTKTTKEANKILIKELRPDANWYSMKKSYNLTVRSE